MPMVGCWVQPSISHWTPPGGMRRLGKRGAHILSLICLGVAILACGTSDPTLLVCSEGKPGDPEAARARREPIEWPAQSNCLGALNLAARAPRQAQPGGTIEVAVRVVNESAGEWTLRYTVMVLDEDGMTPLLKSQEAVVTVPVGGVDKRMLTLAVPESTSPGAYSLRVGTGLRRRIGTQPEPFQITQRIVIRR